MHFRFVILAGGLATRLRPLTTSLPKALIEINGEPFIKIQLRLLKISRHYRRGVVFRLFRRKWCKAISKMVMI